MATSLYNLYFKLISGHDPSVMIDIQREMTEEQAKEIAGISSKIIVSPAKRKEEDKDDLYLLIFKGKKDRTIQTIARYSVLSDDDYNKIVSLSKEIPKENFSIEKVGIDDLIKLIKQEPIEGGMKARRIIRNDIETIIGNIISKSKEKKVRTVIKRKENPDQPNVERFDKEAKAKADNFFKNTEVNQILDKAIQRYKMLNTANSMSYKNPILKEKFYDSLDDFYDKIDAYTSDDNVKKIIFDYHVKSRTGNSKELFKELKNTYNKREPLFENMKTRKRVKEMSGTGGAGGSVPAPGSATANPGSGEGMATKYAFGGAGADPKKKKKKKSLMEDANDPAVAKAHFKYETLKGYVMNLNLKKGIEDINKVKQVYSAMDKINSEVAKLADQYEGKDQKTFKGLDEISANIIKLDNILADMISIIEKAQKNPVK